MDNNQLSKQIKQIEGILNKNSPSLHEDDKELLKQLLEELKKLNSLKKSHLQEDDGDWV